MTEPHKRRPAELAAPITRAPIPAKIRHKVAPRDGTISQAARKLHLTVTEFREKLPELYKRKFPHPDPTTGMFDMVAIDIWQDARNPQVFSGAGNGPLDARTVAEERLARL
jgi:hypothetical protein